MNESEMHEMILEFTNLGFKKERIREKLESLVKTNPEEESLYIQLAIYYFSIEDFPQALRNVKKATLLEPGNEHYWFLQGHIYEKAKKSEYALESYYYSYRLGQSSAKRKLLNFCTNPRLKKLPKKQLEIIKQFKQSLC